MRFLPVWSRGAIGSDSVVDEPGSVTNIVSASGDGARIDTARRLLVIVVMMASGFAALGYQIVWTQQSALWLGNESAAVLAVLAAFFGGLAAGSFWFGGRIDRSRNPARWYGVCEVVIGIWGVLLLFLMAPVTTSLVHLIGAETSPVWHWTVAFVVTFLLLLPATSAMGATLPAMERVLTQLGGNSRVAALYAANTFGALLGVLGTAFWLVPNIGLKATVAVCVALNLLCSVLTWVAFAKPVPPAATGRVKSATMLGMLAATGFLGIGYEVLVVRVLSQVAENTVYTYAILVAIYLLGTAGGAAAYAQWQRIGYGDTPIVRVRDRLLRYLALACLAGVASLTMAAHLKSGLRGLLPATMSGALLGEASLAISAFLLPAICMGALFSHLCTAARRQGVDFGRVLGINVLGAAFAPPIFGVMVFPMLGAAYSFVILCGGYLLLSLRRSPPTPALWAAGACTLALTLWNPSLRFLDIPIGGRLVSHEEGAMAAVSIVQDADGVATLRINNRQQEGSNRTRFFDARQALLPMLLHPAPKRALFLGLGTGVTASSAAQQPGLQVDAVELLPEVIRASVYFRRQLAAGDVDDQFHVINADARRFVRASEKSYDIIVADNFHPARSGSGALYTVEHFSAIRERLEADGLFCQWLPLHQLDIDTLRSIVASFRAVYPEGSAVLATNSLETPVLGLLAQRGVARFRLDQVRVRLSQSRSTPSVVSFGFADEYALLGNFVAGPRALAHFSLGAALNTDDLPIVAYRAPRITYAPQSLPRDRLIALLHEFNVAPEEVLQPTNDADAVARLSAYWLARNRYIEFGRDVRVSSDVRSMLSQVAEPLVSVLRISPDFRPAYDPLVRMAVALAQVDTSAAGELLQTLQKMQPNRTEAADALRELQPPRH